MRGSSAESQTVIVSGCRILVNARSSASANEFRRSSDRSALTFTRDAITIALAPINTATIAATIDPRLRNRAVMNSATMVTINSTAMTSSRSSPRSNVRSAAAGVYDASACQMPPRPVAMKSSAQVPIVNASTTTAAFAAPGTSAAAHIEIAQVNAKRSVYPRRTFTTSAPFRCPPYMRHISIAIANAISDSSHATTSDINFDSTCAARDTGHCRISFSAPLVRSAEIMRMATKGKSSIIASSYAPRDGTTMPSSGERPCGSAPLLTSAYVATAWMNACPTSGPTASIVSQNAREAKSSPRSLRSRTLKCKEDLFEIAELRRRSGRNDFPVVQQQQSIADARRILQLMDREDERAFDLAQQLHRRADLLEIEAVERLVEKHDVGGHEQRERDVQALRLTFRQR